MHRRRGSALLLVLVIGSVLLLGLAALVGSALHEHRSAERAALGSAAFFLAEAGVDRTAQVILDDAFAHAGSAWTARGADSFVRSFPADAASLGSRIGGSTVVVRRDGTLYTVSAKGWVQNPGAALRVERAVEVVFDRVLSGAGAGRGAGCIALARFSASSTGASSISATQPGPVFDSYNSTDNAAPGVQNRGNQALVGTLSAANGDLNLGNGSYFATVTTGSSTTNAAPTVTTATNASPPYNTLTKLDDPATAALTLVDYNPALVRHDLDLTVDSVAPPAVSAADGWFTVYPANGVANSQWKLNGKLSDFAANVSTATANITRSGNALAIGTSDADKHYIATASLDNIASLQISGEVVLVCLGPINASNGLSVTYRTPGAKLTIYSAGDVSGVIRTTRQINTTAAPVPNYEAGRLAIAMLPGNHGLTVAALTPASAHSTVTAALKNPTAGGTVIMNFGDQDTFVGQINAPYSTAQLSAVGQRGKLSDYCGSLLARNISITGSNGFAFHYDQGLGGGGGTRTPTLVRNSWRQLGAADTVFR